MKQFLLMWMWMLASLSPGGLLAQDRAASWPGVPPSMVPDVSQIE